MPGCFLRCSMWGVRSKKQKERFLGSFNKPYGFFGKHIGAVIFFCIAVCLTFSVINKAVIKIFPIFIIKNNPIIPARWLIRRNRIVFIQIFTDQCRFITGTL